MDDTRPAVERHYHWEFIGHDSDEEYPMGKLHWAATVSVLGYDTEDDAKIAASAVLHRKWFILQRVWECPSCGYQGQMIKALGDMTAKIA